MRNVYNLLALFLLLLTAQQGAVNHELAHYSRAVHAELRADAGDTSDATCAQCPAFAQVACPAFSHAFFAPLLVRVASQLTPEPRYAGFDASVPRPRSRGPPSFS
jgi:hypothetical protein